MKKNILLILRSAPYGSSKARDAIDFILTAAAYDQDIHVVFQNDGVFLLLNNQDPSQIPAKNTSSLISAFEMYDIDNIYCERQSLTERSLSEEQLIIQPDLIESTEIQSLIHQADTVLTF